MSYARFGTAGFYFYHHVDGHYECMNCPLNLKIGNRKFFSAISALRHLKRHAKQATAFARVAQEAVAAMQEEIPNGK